MIKPVDCLRSFLYTILLTSSLSHDHLGSMHTIEVGKDIHVCVQFCVENGAAPKSIIIHVLNSELCLATCTYMTSSYVSSS